jgi:hypothetical protein
LALTLAMIPLATGAKLNVAEIQRDLEATWPDLPPPGRAAKKGRTFAFCIGDADVIVTHAPNPIPWPDLETACQDNWLWPDAARFLTGHSSHFVVSISSDQSPRERAILLTQVVAALLVACPGSLGVFWCEGQMAVAAQTFRSFAVGMLSAVPPLFLWINFRTGPNKDGTSFGYTTGLAPLGQWELEAVQAPESPGDLRERMIVLARVLLDRNTPFANGEAISGDDGNPIRAAHAGSAYGRSSRVIRLAYPPLK